MCGILQLDSLCLTKIFNFLTPFDLCAVKQSCTQQVKVGNENMNPNLLLDVIANKCGGTLKGLSLNFISFSPRLGYGSYKKALARFSEKFAQVMEKCSGVFDDLEILELNYCGGNEECFDAILLGHKYSNLTTLTVKFLSESNTDVLSRFWMRNRNIRTLHCTTLHDNLFPLIAKNAPEIEELQIFLKQEKNETNMMSLSSLRKLKRLEIYSKRRDHRTFISLIKELSVNTELEIAALYNCKFNDEFCDALSNFTCLKILRLNGSFAVNDTTSIKMLDGKLPNLESLVLHDVNNFPYRNFLASASKSYKFRMIFVCNTGQREINNFTQQMVKDFIDGKGHHCFVSGNPLCIYISDEMYKDMYEFLTQDNLESVERFGNIKIRQANSNLFNDLLNLRVELNMFSGNN